MKKKRYIVLDLVRSNVLGLNSTQSILASCLFGLLSQDPIQYAGKSYYMADYKNISVYCSVLPNKVDTLRRLYKSLENLGLIQLTKIDNHVCFTPSGMLRDWGTDYECVEAEKNPETGEKSAEQEKNPIKREKNPVEAEKNPVTHINNINNNINDYNIKKEKYKKEKSPENKFSVILDESEDINFEESKQTDITQTLRGTTEPKRCLFANSRFARFEDFEKCFDKPEYKEIDILYYYNSVADWSASKGRMQKDWIAQARNFMRGDKNKGQLHLKPQYDTSHINIADALDFLNENF